MRKTDPKPSTRFLALVLGALVWASAVGSAASAQTSEVTGSTTKQETEAGVSMTADEKKEVIEALNELLSDLYVIPETAATLKERLLDNFEAGNYDSAETREGFAAAVSADLYGESGDAHLRIMFGDQLQATPVRRVIGGPGGDGGAGGPQIVRRMPGGAEGEGPQIVRRMPGGAEGEGPQIVRRMPGGAEGEGPPTIRRVPGEDVAHDSRDAQGDGEADVVVVQRTPGSGDDGGVFENANGIPVAKMLPGNVGLVDIRLFVPREVDETDATEAMKAVEDADALIFDLRLCRGGAPDKVHLITSYLYPSEPFHLLTYYHAHEEPEKAFTLAEVPGRRMVDVDVYILTSPMTASGGEEFSYNLKHHDRATLVGEKTAGAGHGGGVHPVRHGFHAFIPDFRPVHPVTGRGWEGVGVLPDVECPQEKALLVAHELALQNLREKSSEGSGAGLDSALEDVRAKLESFGETPVLEAGKAEEYAGRYGYRTIRARDGVLYLQREGGPELEMVPAEEPDAFTLTRVPQARIQFGRDEGGDVESLRVLAMSGEWEETSRER